MAEKAISLPFAIDAYGKVAQTQDQSKIWADRVRSVIGTTLRERVMRPTFGTIIPYAMFENEDNAQSEIEVEVTRAFTEQLPLLSLSSVTSSADQYTNTLSVEVVYSLPNNEVVSTVVGLVLIQGAEPIYQELL
jgi:phage baseplate assembly protein W